jgi:hypothetical protein
MLQRPNRSIEGKLLPRIAFHTYVAATFCVQWLVSHEIPITSEAATTAASWLHLEPLKVLYENRRRCPGIFDRDAVERAALTPIIGIPDTEGESTEEAAQSKILVWLYALPEV